MTPTDIAALRALVEKATPGPWSAEMFGSLLRDAHNKWDGPPGCEDGIDGFHTPGWEGDPWVDGDLIAAARNALPSLLDEVEALREALEPFAEIARDRNLAGHPDSYAPRPSRGRPNMGDYRRARAALGRSREASNG